MAYWRIIIWSVVIFISCRKPRDHEVQLPGLKAPVDITIDRWGVPHIYAANEHDLFFAQGYQVARDRLFQLELFRRRANGTLAEVLGSKELQRDIGARLFRYRGNLDEEFNHYHPNGKAIIAAFVEGINAFVNQVNSGEQPMPAELKALDIKPGPWTPEIVISRHAGWTSNVQEELSVARMLNMIGEDMTRTITNYHPGKPDLSIDPAIDAGILFDDLLGPYNAFRSPVSFNDQEQVASMPKKSLDGSNNWVVSGTKTRSGFPLMANDPHRVISLPSIRYLVHLNAPGWDVVGGGEPAIPGVSIGHNSYGAWGLTIFETDMEDLMIYELNPGNPAQYRHKGKWVDFIRIRDTIKVKGQADEVVELLFTTYGPVTYVNTKKLVACGIRAAWLQKGGAPYLASLRIDQAQNWNEFREACAYSFVPGENMVWADRSGNIGWQVVGISPVRSSYSGLVPVPGDGRFEWDSILPVLKRPGSLNPKEEFIATANANTTTPDYAHMNSIAFTWADSFRVNRIREVLLRNEKFTLKEMQTLQTDYLSIPAREMVPLIKDLKPIDQSVKQAQQILLNWDYRMSDSSVAASIYFVFEILVERALMEKLGLVNDTLPQFGLSMTKMVRWIKSPGKFMTIQQRDDLLLSALIGSVSVLSQRIGPDINAWQYGQEKMKHAYLAHPLSAKLGKNYDVGPARRGGDASTINSTGSYLNQNFGASVRFIFDCGDWDLALAINTPGQSGDPGSNHYKDLFESWSKDQYFPLYFSKEKVTSAAESKLMLVPAVSSEQ